MRTLSPTGHAGDLSQRRSHSAPSAAEAPGGTWPGDAILRSPETAHVLYAVWAGDPAVVVPSPPGAGKTRLVSLLAVSLAHRAKLRIGIAAQTREQAVQLAQRIGDLSDRGQLLWSRKAPRPALGRCPAVPGARFPAGGGGILVATTARWLYADPTAYGCDVMIVDEAWQVTYGDLGALGAFASQVALVGDPGQIDPVVTGATGRWATRPDAPNLPAPEALRANHPGSVAVVSLPHTWRLGPDTTALIQPTFYPDLPFTSRRPDEHITIGAEPVAELAHRQVTASAGASDPLLAAACADRARELLSASLTTASGTRPVMASDVAVVCAHVHQAATVRAMLADEPAVLVGTANQLQGLERHAVVALHPLAGHRDLGAFAADSGRTCVMLTRHRAHLTVVIDTGTTAALAEADEDTADQMRLINDLAATCRA